MQMPPINRSLRIIYMGTPEFAVPALENLVAEGWNVVAVITAPDKPKVEARSWWARRSKKQPKP
jgi:methionyl-tRNA formyltransferase